MKIYVDLKTMANAFLNYAVRLTLAIITNQLSAANSRFQRRLRLSIDMLREILVTVRIEKDWKQSEESIEG